MNEGKAVDKGKDFVRMILISSLKSEHNNEIRCRL